MVAIIDDTKAASEVDRASTVAVGGGGSGAVRVGEVVTTILDRVATEEAAAVSEELGTTDGARVCSGILM